MVADYSAVSARRATPGRTRLSCAARLRKGHTVAAAADAAVRDAIEIAAIEGDEQLDPVLVLALLEQVLHAAEIALAF
jgi:hypothetical protein